MTAATANLPLNLHDFLAEAELQDYYGVLRNDLKVTNVSQLKYVEDADLNQIGMSRPEQRRLKKFFHKYYPQTYLGKFVKIIQTKTSSSAASHNSHASSRRYSGMDQWEVRRDSGAGVGAATVLPPPTKSGKHIIPFDSIKLCQVLATGHFATVYAAIWTNDENNISTQVAVKCLNKDRFQANPKEFVKDAAVMHSLEHPRIVKFFGATLTTDPQWPIWLVTEVAPNRSLLECLRDSQLKSGFSVMTLCDTAVQICDGMKYLETKLLVHKNLSAKNILVFSKLKVKIADFGLPQPVCIEESVGTSSQTQSRWAAWCAPECVRKSQYSSASDAWAFGVTLWEMFSFGLQPWAGFTEHEIVDAVDSPYFRRLEQPEMCPKDYYETMLRCWSDEGTLRPTFAQLFETLPELKPEQLQAIRECMIPASLHKNRLLYTVGDVIVVLDNNPEESDGLWKGTVKNRKAGMFDPSDTVTYLGTDVLPVAVNCEAARPSDRRVVANGKSKIRRDMISRPQADFRHTGHVGMDGAYFGDVSFLGNGFGPLPSMARSYDRAEDERSIGYGGSRDTTPLISSRLSLARTIGSESRMSSDSWQNTSSDSPRSGSSSSCGNAKENCRIASPAPQRKPSISMSYAGSARNGKSVFQNSHMDMRECNESNDRFGRSPYNGSEKRFMHLNPHDDKSFDLDFGPSLMDEVLKVINNNCNMDSVMSARDPEPVPAPTPAPLPRLPNLTELMPPPPDPPFKVLPVRAASVCIREAPPDKPPVKPKPRVMARKKPDAIAVLRDEAPPTSLKPVSPRDEKVIENFINLTNEVAAKSITMDNANFKNQTLSPTAGSIKSRFSFRGLLTKSNDSSAPTTPRTFLEQRPAPKELEEHITDSAKEAYRVLVEEGKVEIHCVPPSPIHSSFNEDDEEDMEAASPLKLLRNGVGVLPKMRGNRNGSMNGFNRSLSHEPPKVAPKPVAVSQSFRFPAKMPEEEQPPTTPTPSIRQQPPPDLGMGKKIERPNVPPPLPPRDRSKVIQGPPEKPRERMHPLILPESEPSIADVEYQNPDSPGLLREKLSRRFSDNKLNGSVLVSEEHSF